MKLIYAIVSAVAIAPSLLGAAYYSCPACQSGGYDQGDVGYYQGNYYPSSGYYQGHYNYGNYAEDQGYTGQRGQNYGGQYGNSQGYGQYNQNYRGQSRDGQSYGGQYYQNSSNPNRNNSNGNSRDNPNWDSRNNSGQNNQALAAQDAFKTQEDRDLLKRIRQELSNRRELNQNNVTIIVVDKKIQLKGIAGSKDESAKFEETVTAIEGVNGVDNQLDYPNKSTSWWGGSKTEADQSGNKDNDHILLERIQGVIDNDRDAGKYDDVEIHVEKNIVILKGNLDSEQTRAALKNRIQQVQGVNQVNDQTSVNNKKSSELAFSNTAPSNTSVSDQVLKTNIEDKLRGGFFSKGFEQIEVIVNNGSVIVRGVVDSPSDIKTLSDRIQGIDGVQSIDNQAVIRKISK
ncbi:MAG: BON domain-containing protein [Parachlamydiales bacterium]|jgi:osmotically-inducible protein OsmY